MVGRLDKETLEALEHCDKALTFFIECLTQRAPGWEALGQAMYSCMEVTALDEAINARHKAREIIQRTNQPQRVLEEGAEKKGE